jgi:hypothetical protein
MGASADNTATFAIDLQTQGAQANADALGGSLESLGTSIDENAALTRTPRSSPGCKRRCAT